MHTPSEAQVLAAADAIVAAFAATDTAAYFAGFAPEATFIFHPEAARLVQAFPGGAVFSHTVATSVETPEGGDSYVERESIIFRNEGDALIAIHEHLSTTPEDAA